MKCDLIIEGIQLFHASDLEKKHAIILYYFNIGNKARSYII